MYAYRYLSRCGQLTVLVARELFAGLKTLGAALIGAPLPPEAFPPAGQPGHRATPPGGTVADDSTDRPATGGPDRSPAGSDPGAPPAGHPERLIPHVPPTSVERQLWSQLR
ncbi:hypothetical protein GA0074692_3084 [Micromonospora pallida]|uniref:Uncharacterized protein n=1 Tax=Micromonospora pallida TaxID=145854 RepID=A0A1C6SP89_9ACTN|nr:DUF6059 family protein [Micromonospora pallida]SCL31287.1 hypothetical protein GA0074692_3084 [Micromonospora pallida]